MNIDITAKCIVIDRPAPKATFILCRGVEWRREKIGIVGRIGRRGSKCSMLHLFGLGIVIIQ
jgi:hypothetical protein